MGHDTSYGNTTPALPGGDAGATTGTTPVSADISGLTEYTFYHYRLVTTNSIGTTHGVDRTFYSAPPIVPGHPGNRRVRHHPDERDDLRPDQPRLRHDDLHRRIRTRLRATISTRRPVRPLDPDNVLHPVSQSLTGLDPATTYHYRIVAINFGGVCHTPDMTFTTPARAAGRLDLELRRRQQERDAGSERSTRISLRPPTTSSTAPMAATDHGPCESASIGPGHRDAAASAQLSGLAPGTTYHFRVSRHERHRHHGRVRIRPSRHRRRPPAVRPPPAAQKCKAGFVRKHGKCVGKRRHAEASPSPHERPRKWLSGHGRRASEERSESVQRHGFIDWRCSPRSLLAAAGAGSASAAITHLYVKNFSVTGGNDPIPQAVDANGNILFYNNGNHTVERTDSEGNPVPFSALGIAVIDGAGGTECPAIPADCDKVPSERLHRNHLPNYTLVAVDNSNGPASGDIYVVNPVGNPWEEVRNGQIEVFAPTGKFIGEIDQIQAQPINCRQPTGNLAGCEYGGISVDKNGLVYIFDSHGRAQSHRAVGPDRRHAGGRPLSRRAPGQQLRQGWARYGETTPGIPLPCSLDFGVATADYTYCGSGQSPPRPNWRKYPPSEYQRPANQESVPLSFLPDLGPFGPLGGHDTSCNCPEQAYADQSTQHIFVIGNNYEIAIQEWDENNHRVGPLFGGGHIGGAGREGIAIDGSNGPNRGSVYVRSNGSQIAMFGPPVEVPDISYSPRRSRPHRRDPERDDRPGGRDERAELQGRIRIDDLIRRVGSMRSADAILERNGP